MFSQKLKIAFITLFSLFIISQETVFGVENAITTKSKEIQSEAAKKSQEFNEILQNSLTTRRILAPGKLEAGLRRLLGALAQVCEYVVYYKLGEGLQSGAKKVRNLTNPEKPKKMGGIGELNWFDKEVVHPIAKRSAKVHPVFYGAVAAVAGKALLGNKPQAFIQEGLNKLKKLIFPTRIHTLIKKEPTNLNDNEKYLLKAATCDLIYDLLAANFIDKNLFLSNQSGPFANRLAQSLPTTLDAVIGPKAASIRSALYAILTTAKGLDFSWDGTTLNGSWTYVSDQESDETIKRYLDLFKAIETFVKKAEEEKEEEED